MSDGIEKTPEILKVGLIGGGSGSFIAQPHQRAVHMDGTRRIHSVALSSDPQKALLDAEQWPYPVQGYKSYQALYKEQAKLPKSDRLDYIIITTPNFAHYEPAMMALDLGIPVFCEKPLSLNLDEAIQLVKKVEETQVPFALAHTYIGHWSSQLSRHIVQSGLIGEVRWVDSYYLQGWLADKLEATGQTQASWRTDPKRAGASGAGGDIGIHALQQLRYVTGLEVLNISAHCEKFVEGRPIDDHFTVYGQLNNGGKCLVRASQICHGHKNDLGLVVTGTKGVLKWNQEKAEAVTICLPGQPDRIYWRGEVNAHDGFLNDLPSELLESSTLPSGHVEGLHDAFARLHRAFEDDIRAWKDQRTWQSDGTRYATVYDGRIGMAFIDAAMQSQAEANQWTAVPFSNE
jgi:predicted dehydrogenase